ncbi:hypothetical protein BYT27DRAFT_7341092 [Phlegmacium glaucopus]|nr:hypothetical protein BYT27DRAFT_7341092 [Phlegmacium glaucopus]
MTSTPNAKFIFSGKRKPEPIPFTASPSLLPIDGPAVSFSSPLSSPPVTKVYGRTKQDQLLEKSMSLPAIPSTTALLPLPSLPTTPTRNRDDVINDNNKRPLNSPDRAVKKARTMPSLDSSLIGAGSPRLTTVFPPSTPHEDGTNLPLPLPTTPKRQNLPTLTELLASAKKGKKKSHSPKSLKPKSAVGAGVDSNNKSKFRFPSPLPHPPVPPLSPIAGLEDNPYMLDPYAISVNHSALELDIDLDLSPTKSLSSLAGSDSEDDDDDELNRQLLGSNFPSSSFNPYVTSTQHQNYAHEGGSKVPFITGPHSSPFLGENGRAVLSLGFGGYNSQFDVAGQVDKVDKLLEKDVDYEGWLRDPSLEREGVKVDESP